MVSLSEPLVCKSAGEEPEDMIFADRVEEVHWVDDTRDIVGGLCSSIESEIESETESVEIDSDIDKKDEAEEADEEVVVMSDFFWLCGESSRIITVDEGDGGEEEDLEDPPEDERLKLLRGSDFGLELFCNSLVGLL